MKLLRPYGGGTACRSGRARGPGFLSLKDRTDMDLFDRISEDIKKAMLAREKVRLEALRGVKKEFLEARTAKGAGGELPDEDTTRAL